ncbi:uncharacterized protein DUF3489 [Sphingomonas sp. PP-F2F-A104-K0414]|uniref:DUF3489 domain-containing protein n=1 Tax=Sphingomonas sp. PP-F2F-A104-K0414 TaxID=2135661 RepID=UPI0010533EA4|nr:DUF3489 domain-containing protein [Sphingomonas sp. PP-F2F-A104-K0414]TCQ01038.1 uncharacterized protein DUF3489 [Sphingomonas sp. PP-F2F-A104-K0414]
MTKLSDTQAILLASACQRADGSMLPLPTSIKPGGGAAKAVAALLRQQLAEEREVVGGAPVHRTDGDISVGLFVTTAGRVAIGMADASEQTTNTTPAPSPEIADAGKTPTKIATVLALIGRPDGALASELTEATGWLPHTMRAALTGLRKKGHAVERVKCSGVTGYRIMAAA